MPLSIIKCLNSSLVRLFIKMQILTCTSTPNYIPCLVLKAVIDKPSIIRKYQLPFRWQYNNGIACNKKQCFTLISITSTQAHINKILYCFGLSTSKLYETTLFLIFRCIHWNYVLSMVLADYVFYVPTTMLYCIIKWMLWMKNNEHPQESLCYKYWKNLFWDLKSFCNHTLMITESFKAWADYVCYIAKISLCNDNTWMYEHKIMDCSGKHCYVWNNENNLFVYKTFVIIFIVTGTFTLVANYRFYLNRNVILCNDKKLELLKKVLLCSSNVNNVWTSKCFVLIKLWSWKVYNSS